MIAVCRLQKKAVGEKGGLRVKGGNEESKCENNDLSPRFGVGSAAGGARVVFLLTPASLSFPFTFFL